MFIFCEYCEFRCVCYDDWMEHLMSKDHQNVINECIENWSSDLNERSVIITINETTKPERQDICWYFANYGLVSDLFFEPSLEFCVVQLDKRDYVQHALTIEHDIGGVALSLKCKADLSEAEWMVLNSMVRRKGYQEHPEEVFENNHAKLIETLGTLPIDSQVEHFGKEVKMKPIEIEIRKKLLEDLSILFKTEFPDCVLCPYGSFVTGLANNTSVLDVYFDKSGQSLLIGKSSDKMITLEKDAMNEFQAFMERINKIEKFCYDITLMNDSLTFVHKNTGALCNFSCESFLPVQTSKMITFLLKLDPRLPNLFLFLKYWSTYHKLTGPKLITSYSLNLLIIVFLSKKKIIPSVSVLQSISNTIVQVGGWDTSFCDDVSKVTTLMSFIGSSYKSDSKAGNPTAHSILQLAVEFFEMYANTDFQSHVVCPAIGDFLPKTTFDSSQEANLPKSFDAYKNWVSVRKNNARFDTTSLLCVQDPFNLSCNVSSQAPQSTIWKFQFLCAEASNGLQSLLNSENPKLMTFFQPLPSSTEDLIIDQNKASQITKSTMTSKIEKSNGLPNNGLQTNIEDFNVNTGVNNIVDTPQFQEDGTLDPLLQAVLINAGVLPQFWPTSSTVQQTLSLQQPQIFNQFQPCNSNPNDIFLNPQQLFNPFLNQFPNPVVSQSPGLETSTTFPIIPIPNQGTPDALSPQPVPPPSFQDIVNSIPNPFLRNFSDTVPLFQVPDSAVSPLPNQVTSNLQVTAQAENVNEMEISRLMTQQMNNIIAKSMIRSSNSFEESNHQNNTNGLTDVTISNSTPSPSYNHPPPPGTSPKNPEGVHKMADAFQANNFVNCNPFFNNSAPRNLVSDGFVPHRHQLFPITNSSMNFRYPPAYFQQRIRRDPGPPRDSPCSSPRPIIPITVSKPISNYNYGSFEKIVNFPPHDTFVDIFDEYFGNLISKECTSIRLKVLWCSFLKDFFTDVWTKSFNFDAVETGYVSIPSNQATPLEIMVYNDKDSTTGIREENDPQGAKRIKLEEEVDMAPQGTSDDDVKNSSGTKYRFTAKLNPLKQRFFDLKMNLVDNKAFICTANNNFSEARKKIRSLALLDTELLSTYPSPLEFEAEVTRRVEAQNDPLLYTCKFGIKMWINVSENGQGVELSLREIKEDNSRNLWINNIADHIFSVLRDTVPKYQLFRLKKWLEY